jgi:outer membrane protein TolC
MTKRAMSGGLILASAAIAFLAGRGTADAPRDDASRKLAEAQLALAQQAISDLDQLCKSGEASFADPRFALWDRRQVEALRALGMPKPELLKALKSNLERHRSLASHAEQAFKSGQATHIDVLDAQYAALQAEMWLNQERAR